jgi:hypothetical protein
MIATPPYSTFPMGHATEAYLAGYVLLQLVIDALPTPTLWQQKWLTEVERMLDRLAQRVSDNRVVAGIHFPRDTAGGRELALRLWSYMKDRRTATVDGSAFPGLWAQAVAEWKAS